MNNLSTPRAFQVRLVLVCLIIALAAPLVVFVALSGLKAGAWGIDIAYDVLTWKVGLALAGAGAIGALIAAVAGLTAPRRAGLLALLAVAISAATVGLFWREAMSKSSQHAVGGISTNAIDPPAFPAGTTEEREATGADPLAPNPGPNGCEVQTLPTQVAPGTAGYALREAGFSIRSLGVGRAEGSHVTLWFDRTYDAVIRIRPRQTDVRVVPRDNAHDQGVSCRLARKLIANLQPRP